MTFRNDVPTLNLRAVPNLYKKVLALSLPFWYCSGMDMRTYWESSTKQERDELAAKVDQSYEYLRHIAKGRKRPSPDLAKRLCAAERRLTLHDLRPDVWLPEKKSSKPRRSLS